MILLSLTLLVAAWSFIAIEVKRWHDLDKSGWCVLLRLVSPILVATQLPYAAIIGQIFVIALSVVLGFFPGACAAGYNDTANRPAPAYSRPGRFAANHPSRPAQPVPPSSSPWGILALGCLFSLFLLCAVVIAFFLGRASLHKPSSLPFNSTSGATNSVASSPPATNAPAPASAPSPANASALPNTSVLTNASSPVTTTVTTVTPSPPTPTAALPITATVTPAAVAPGSINDDILKREHVDQTDMTAMYAKDWVIANGQKLTGITKVTAIPGIQVNIVYSGGDTNLMAASLPPGFRDLWGITPEALEEANKPKPPPQ
jgi:hypothetical protein